MLILLVVILALVVSGFLVAPIESSGETYNEETERVRPEGFPSGFV